MYADTTKMKHRTFVVTVVLSLVFLRVFFYHRSYGTVTKTSWDGIHSYIHLSDGRVYRASACEGEHTGNYIQFIALGLDLSFLGDRTAVPVIIYCKFPGAWMDDGELQV